MYHFVETIMRHKSITVFSVVFILLSSSCLTTNTLQKKFELQIEYDKTSRLIGHNFYKFSDIAKCKSDKDLLKLPKYKLLNISIDINKKNEQDEFGEKIISGFSVTYTLESNNNIQKIIETWEYRNNYAFFPTGEGQIFKYSYREEDSFFLTFRKERKYLLRGNNEYFEAEIDIASNQFTNSSIFGIEGYLICIITSKTMIGGDTRLITQAFENSMYGYLVNNIFNRVYVDNITSDAVNNDDKANKTRIKTYLWFYGKSANNLYSIMDMLVKANPPNKEPNKNENSEILCVRLYVASTEINLYPVVFDDQIMSINDK